MKKTIAALALFAVMLTAMPLTVFAHGHSHGTDSSAACNSLCSVENCNETWNHQHDGVTYSGHYIGDGHDYHQACTTEGCTRTGCHEHNGTVCLPHSGNGCNGASGSHHNGSHHGGNHH